MRGKFVYEYIACFHLRDYNHLQIIPYRKPWESRFDLPFDLRLNPFTFSSERRGKVDPFYLIMLEQTLSSSLIRTIIQLVKESKKRVIILLFQKIYSTYSLRPPNSLSRKPQTLKKVRCKLNVIVDYSVLSTRDYKFRLPSYFSSHRVVLFHRSVPRRQKEICTNLRK